MSALPTVWDFLARGFWIAFAVAAIAAYPVWRLLLLTKSRQTVSQYAPEGHQAKQGTPTMGGIIIVLGYISALVWMLAAGVQASASTVGRNVTFEGGAAWPYLCLAVGFALIGFIDDFVVPRMLKGKRGLGWKQKIVMQLAIAMVAAWLATGGFGLEFGVYTFLILFFSNAYNFSDGLDGLAGTLLIGMLVGLCGISILSPTLMPVALFLAPLAGAVIPFLYLNAPPARVFMGDVGSLPIGAVLGLGVAQLAMPALTEGSTDAVPFLVPVALAIVSVMMIVELVPVPLQILSVKLRKKKLFPYTPIHHAFEKAGWPESRVVWMFALTQLMLSLIAVSLLTPMSVQVENLSSSEEGRSLELVR